MAYKCSKCRHWIPSYPHADDCPYRPSTGGPTYEYRCKECDELVELKTREPGPHRFCGGELKRIYSVSVAFKGKGFYRTGG